MEAKELRNQVINKLWHYDKLPKNIQTLMTDNEVDFMLEVINTYVAEKLTIHSVVSMFVCDDCGEPIKKEDVIIECKKCCNYKHI